MRRLPLLLVVVAAAAAAPAARAAPVNPWLPWHAAVVGSAGLRPWTDYGSLLGLGWRYLERVPVDRRAGVRSYLAYPVFDPATGQGLGVQHDPASLYAGMVASLLPWYAYSGDGRAVAVVRRMLDYQLAHGTTPRGWAWSRVPFATSCAGARAYGGCLAGMPRGFRGGIEPDKVGLLGLGYLRFYELTGGRRYLAAARDCALALARRVRAGGDGRTPWPFRLDGRTGRTVDGAEYGGMLVGPIQLLDELARLGGGADRPLYVRARDLAVRWLLTHQLDPESPDHERFSGYYEDVAYDPDDVDSAIPTATAIWLLTRPHPEQLDPDWLAHARGLLAWTRRTFGRGPFAGATGIDEQRSPGRTGCCSPAGVGSDTARFAAANALLAARTGDRAARRAAVGSLAYAAYFADSRGRVSCCGSGHPRGYWFSDGYGDYLGNVSLALAALPQLAPAGETHLLGSTGVVRQVSYGRRSVAYRTFAAASTETLRVAFRPRTVLAGGARLPRRSTLAEPGWTLTRAGADYVLRIRHSAARSVLVRG